MIETMEQFIEALNIESCDILGYSMGGAIAYILYQDHPEIIRKSVLVSPGFQSCMSASYLNDMANGGKANHCFETRTELNEFLCKTSTPDRTKKNPLPKVFLEPIIRDRERNTPSHYFEKMTQSLRDTMIQPNSNFHYAMVAQHDIDPNADRLVFWPDQDHICTHARGKDFFSDSNAIEFVTVENCGHIFDRDGKAIYGKVAPQITSYLFGTTQR
mmetsp:Transcript_10979/g.15474  ORF Transcript_10979/g.15474 Transcript_10979/m.15474 type:complete len:215 (+) Transcript_10979:1402-2046(+)